MQVESKTRDHGKVSVPPLVKATGALATIVVDTIEINFPAPVTPTSVSMCAVPSLSDHLAHVAVRLVGPEKFSAVAVVMLANVSVPVGDSVAQVVEFDETACTKSVCPVTPVSGVAGRDPS